MVRKPLDLASGAITRRRNSYGGQMQLMATEILYQPGQRRTKNAFCMVGITMKSPYPDSD